MFALRQIVWAKTKNYPWWPAEINKLPSPDQNVFRVTFVGQTNHAHLEEKAVKKYLQNYEEFKKNTYKGLQNSIELADIQIKKRTAHMNELQQRAKNNKNTKDKSKKIKKSKKKPSAMKRLLKQIKPLNDHLKTFQADPPAKIQKKPSQECSAVKMHSPKSGELKSESQSLMLSEEESSIQVIQLDYMNNIDRKRIQSAEEKLFTFITQFNSGFYDKERDCLDIIDKIDHEDLRPEELLQSKITNMITYIHKKLSQRTQGHIKKDQISRIATICHKLKTKIHSYLFDCRYYDQFLKLMDKNCSHSNPQKEEKPKTQTKVDPKKSRRIKRKPLAKNKPIPQVKK